MIVDVVFMLALLAVVGLALILRAVLLLAKVDGFVSPARTFRHDLYLIKVRHRLLGYVVLNHSSSLFFFILIYKYILYISVLPPFYTSISLFL